LLRSEILTVVIFRIRVFWDVTQCAPVRKMEAVVSSKLHSISSWRTVMLIQSAAERTPLFEKRINSKPKKIRQMFFYFWKEHRMPFYINVF